MAWPPRVRILGKNGQFIECRKRSLPSSPTAWVTCHGALESLGWPHGQIWTNSEKNHCISLQPNTHYISLYIHLGNSWFLTHPEINGSILGRAFRICKRWDSEASNGASPVRSQETRTIYCQTYPKMNRSCMIMWLLHVTLHVQYIESWMHVFYISLPGCWIIELSDDIYIYIVSTPNSWTLVG